jgi:Fe-S-cluster-containing hydrogenase component 2
VAACPVEALSLVSAHDPSRPARKRASLDPRVCLGCGVCVQACRRGAIRLERRAVRVLTPLDTTHRVVLMALERGRLADLVFDRQTSGHRALAAVLGAILALPPVQRALASEQVRSRCLEALIESRRQSTA